MQTNQLAICSVWRFYRIWRRPELRYSRDTDSSLGLQGSHTNI